MFAQLAMLNSMTNQHGNATYASNAVKTSPKSLIVRHVACCSESVTISKDTSRHIILGQLNHLIVISAKRYTIHQLLFDYTRRSTSL